MRHLCMLTLIAVLLPLTLSAQARGDLPETGVLQSMYYQFFMYPFNDVPPAAIGGDFAFADAEVQIHAKRDGNTHELTEAWVNFHIEYSFDLPQNLVAMHIHKGRFFEAGPVVISSGMTRVDDARIGELWFQVEVTAPEGLAAIEGIFGDRGMHFTPGYPISCGRLIRLPRTCWTISE